MGSSQSYVERAAFPGRPVSIARESLENSGYEVGAITATSKPTGAKVGRRVVCFHGNMEDVDDLKVDEFDGGRLDPAPCNTFNHVAKRKGGAQNEVCSHAASEEARRARHHARG